MEKGFFPMLISAALFFFLLPPSSATLTDETQLLLQFKKQLKDPLNALLNWKDSASPCDFFGIYCSPNTHQVTGISLANRSLEGEISASICGLPRLESLVLTANAISGNVPQQLANCTGLRILDLSNNNLSGPLPDFSALERLEILDFSENYISGEFPKWVEKLSGLTSLSLAENDFNEGRIPEGLGKLKNLTLIYMANCNFTGEIPSSIFELTLLETLDFSKNKLSGDFPKEIVNLHHLTKIELYSNNLTGSIPPEFANLTHLREFDISHNQMTGELPDGIGNLTNLVVFQLYENHFSGEIPKGFGDMTKLVGFSIYRNGFTGEFPQNFGHFSPLRSIDISENQFSGAFPRFLCEGRNLIFLLALDNNFSGEFPDTYSECMTLERFRVSQNRLFGNIADGIWGLPHAKIIDLAYNSFTGRIPPGIAASISLNELSVQNNRFSGELPSELGALTQLQKIYASKNLLSGKIPSQLSKLNQLSSLHLEENSLTGEIPSELSQCARLIDLNLASNSLSGKIPPSLSQLSSLNSLNLSHNSFSGPIPESLQTLKLSSIDFSQNQLSGNIPSQIFIIAGDQAFLGNKDLCISHNLQNRTAAKMVICSPNHIRRQLLGNTVAFVCIILLALAVVIGGLCLVSYRSLSHEELSEANDLERGYMKDPNWKIESFHQKDLDAEELNKLEEQNLIGCGGTGKVYRLDLKKGGAVAVKQLCKGNEVKAMMAEMEILGKIRHRNVLKLYACMTRGHFNSLVYEFMPNGNLFQALRREIKGKPELDWNRRYKIALGAAKGIAYLHHDCSPAIIHRDLKSSNILLDEDYEAKIADFGIAKIAADPLCRSDSSSFAGTYGYIAPELAYSLKVSEKSDIYSFGVVLLEIITGKNPVEPEYGEGKDIVYWVSSHLNCKKDAVEILDQRVSLCNEDEMIKVLKVALLCTAKLPSLRPTMREVLNMLLDVDPGTVVKSDKTCVKYW